VYWKTHIIMHYSNEWCISFYISLSSYI
jgi:hypothetical protein